MLFITVPNQNDSISSLVIDGTEYLIRFTYNETCDDWSFGLYDAEEMPIISMTRIVPNFPLLHFYTDTRLPDGVFGCLSASDNVGREAFNKKIAEFVFIPTAEMEE